MRNVVEIALALVVLLVGGSLAALWVGGMPPVVEENARLILTTTRVDRLIDLEKVANARTGAEEAASGAPAGRRGAGGAPSAGAPGATASGGGRGRAGGGAGGGGRGGATVITATPVRVEPFVDFVRAIGTGQATRSVTLVSEVAGTIETVHFTSNSVVEAGQELVTFDRAEQAITLERTEAELASAKAAFDRLDKLARGKSGAVSTAQVDTARTALAVAEAGVAQAKFEFERRVVRAPFAGRIGLDDLSAGQFLAQNQPLVTLDDVSGLRVEFIVPEAKAGLVAPGRPIDVTTPAIPGRTFKGEVAAVDSRVNATTRTLRVRATVPNEDGLLRPGTTFSVTVRIEEQPMPVVPALAVQWSREGAFVWRVTGDKAEKVPITITKRDGDNVFVSAELKADDAVATEGAQKLDERSTVAVAGAPGRTRERPAAPGGSPPSTGSPAISEGGAGTAQAASRR